ncbi:MAG: Lrp/AsnC family transcriptional regulator [Nanoarchaeota archaeon]|nr:Lrp/AsnC family transcriptional regulator [Nanoarchaeota archaeon]
MAERKEKKIKEELKQAVDFSNQIKSDGILVDISPIYLSKKFSVPVNQVKKNLKSFKKYKIAKFGTTLNYQKLPIFNVVITIKSTHPKYNSSLVKDLVMIPLVESVYQISGTDATHFVRARVPTFEQISTLVSHIATKFKDKIELTETMITKKIIEEEQYFYENEPFKPEKLDEIDMKILSCLNSNAEMTLKEIGKKVDLREPSVYRRIKILKEKKIILGYNCIRRWVNIPAKLQPIRAMLTMRIKAKEINEASVLNDIKKFSRVVFSYEVFGRYSLIMLIDVDSPFVLYKMIDELSKNENLLEIQTYLVVNSLSTLWSMDYS